MDLPNALTWLDSHLNRELVPGATQSGKGLSLQAMERLCHILGDPQDTYGVIHVTGTNGKGSVVEMVSGLLDVSGLTVGTYTSPHVHHINERIRRNGEPIDDESLAEVLGEIRAAAQLVDEPLSWFEIVTAAALSWFATSPVDVAVVEVGMLGLFDATNVVDASVAVVTNVGFDHTDGNGDWERDVASEKAGIVPAGSTLVLGDVTPRLRPVFTDRKPARLWALGSDISQTNRRQAVGGQVVDIDTPVATHDAVFIAAHGHHQATNAALAIGATEAFFDRPLDDDVISETFGALELPGRLTVAQHQPLVVIDGAHNPPAGASLARTLTEDFSVDGRRLLVFGMLADRDPAAFLGAVEPIRFDAVIVCTPPTPRGFPANSLASIVAAAGLPVEVVPDPSQAVTSAVAAAGEDGLVVITGSLYLVDIATNSLGGASGT